MKRGKSLLYIILFLIPFQFLSANAEEIGISERQENDTTVIRLRDYGLERIRKNDCTTIIEKALSEINDSTPTIILFPRGEYHFYAEQSIQRNLAFPNENNKKSTNCAILLEGKMNIIIDGNESTLIFHGLLQPFTFLNCENITLRNIRIDWEQPFLAQAKVVKVNDAFIELAIDLKDYPYRIENGKLYFDVAGYIPEIWKSVTEFERKDRYIVSQTENMEYLGKGWENYTAENIIPGVIRLYYPFLRKPKLGNFLVMKHTDLSFPGIYIHESKNIKLNNLNIYHSIGAGILAQNSENLAFNTLDIIPNKAQGRYFSSSERGLFLSDCEGEINIDNCEFDGIMNSTITIENNAIQLTDNNETERKYSILNSQIKSSLGSGIQIQSANNFIIRNNYFESSGSAILLRETTNNIRIENNNFTDLCHSGDFEESEAIVTISSEKEISEDSTLMGHENIAISNNTFNPFDYQILSAQRTNHINFENNTILRSERFEPFHQKPFSFVFEDCKRIQISENIIGENVLGKNIQLKQTPHSELDKEQQLDLEVVN